MRKQKCNIICSSQQFSLAEIFKHNIKSGLWPTKWWKNQTKLEPMIFARIQNKNLKKTNVQNEYNSIMSLYIKLCTFDKILL